MTPRPPARTPRVAALLALALAMTVVLGGCDPRQAFFFLQPFEPTIPPPCPELKGKKVVVITKVVPGAGTSFVTLDRELTRQVVSILREKVKKIEVVSPDKVYDWEQAHRTWTDPSDLARAFDADMVVFIEVRNFQIESPSSPDMFEGHSNIHIRVTGWAHPTDDKGHELADQPKESKDVYDGDRDTVFPGRGPIPVSAEVTRTSFKNKFLKLVANEVSWHFVEHAPGDDIQEVKFQD